jgi:hypothetical protein
MYISICVLQAIGIVPATKSPIFIIASGFRGSISGLGFGIIKLNYAMGG